MSKQTEKQTKQVKKSNKNEKKGIGSRLGNFFRELRGELKLVVWPDKEKMKQSAGIVFGIILASALLIFAVDTIVNQSLTAAGFYNERGAVSQQAPTPDKLPAESPATSQSTTAGSGQAK